MSEHTEDKKSEMPVKSKIAEREEATLAFWKEHGIFEKSIAKEAPKGDFIFYDGPPFATGTPHAGHMLPTTVKDLIPRYKTMKGYRVPRRWGWDCHGLPLENMVEKELGLKEKKDIEKLGIDVFNDAAKKFVLKYEEEWKAIMPRTGRWVDMDNPYTTMDADYTQSVWWAFKELSDKGLVEEGFKSMHLCPRCETTLSNFEVNQGYKDITDISVTVKFELDDEPETFILAWTTTPWTLPGNVALAVRADIEYVKVVIETEGGKEITILAKDRIADVLKDKKYEIIDSFTGNMLVGKSYNPPFNYYKDGPNFKYKENAWKIYEAPYVTTDAGTGIVHLAPAFGEEDMVLANKYNIPLVQHVAIDGTFKKEVTDFASLHVKPKGDHQSTDIEIIKYLAERGLLFAKEKITHSYPHCWRCDTPLLNYATSSWFVLVTKIKEKLIKENGQIGWVPSDIRDGRFGKWLEGARDWAVSRTRYWGAPLPVWKCAECDHVEIVGSLPELLEKIPGSGNTYTLMRHGEADHNVLGIFSGKSDNPHHLTEKGKAEVRASAKKIKQEGGVDVIIASPFVRTRETVAAVADVLGFLPDKVIYDDRLHETYAGNYDGKPFDDYNHVAGPDMFDTEMGGVENTHQVYSRAAGFLFDIDSKYRGKKILIISHGHPLRGLESASQALSLEDIRSKFFSEGFFFQTGSFKHISFKPFPHNAQYELDYHRPYIDTVEFSCPTCGRSLRRIPDVFDCWFESGSMPYGRLSYPAKNRELFDPTHHKGYPADFIAEGLDQTRGWFYTLLVLGTALFDESPYKNVIVSGILLAEDGQKMSKRLNNYPPLRAVIDKYGADALRYFLVASPLVRAEEADFSERGIDEVVKKIIMRFENVVSFYLTYGDVNLPSSDKSTNVLDRWIIERLKETERDMSQALDTYELDRGARPTAGFVDDLSTWYLRRSRDRFKSDDKADAEAASQTTLYVLREFSKLLAPYMPFVSEHIWQQLKKEGDAESVHLASWPEYVPVDQTVLETMKQTRLLTSIALELRSKAGIKVRQPLSLLKIKAVLPEEYMNILKEELNVKAVVIDPSIEQEAWLDTVLTEELKTEGEARDLIRLIQEERKKQGFMPGESAIATVQGSSIVIQAATTFIDEIKKTCGLKEITLNTEENISVAVVVLVKA